MPRKRTWPPTIYPHKSSGLDRIRIDGHDVYLGPIGSEESRINYARVLHDYQSTGSPPPPAREPAQPSVSMVVAAWMVEAERERGVDNGELRTFRHTTAVLLATAGNVQAAEFDTLHLEQVRNAMASGSWRTAAQTKKLLEKNQPLGWCRNVINRCIVRIGTIWRWAERRKLVPVGSYHGLKTLPGLSITSKVARQTKRPVPATVEQLRAVRRFCPQPVNYMLTVQWWTGMRSAEVRTMRVGEVDRTDPTLAIYRPATHKTAWRGQTRAVPLDPLSMAIVGKLSAGKQPEEYVFTPSQRRRSKLYTKHTYAQAVRRAAALAGLPGWHPYLLRHGLA